MLVSIANPHSHLQQAATGLFLFYKFPFSGMWYKWNPKYQITHHSRVLLKAVLKITLRPLNPTGNLPVYAFSEMVNTCFRGTSSSYTVDLSMEGKQALAVK